MRRRRQSVALKIRRIWKDIQLLMKPVVILSGLGYMVDAFDLMTFSVVRTSSLQSLGLDGEALTKAGMLIINMQMAGIIIGGLVWGMLGDKLGRMKVILASIAIYSVANIGNGFAMGVHDYAVWRFMAGFGLAGEVGSAVTIVAESLPRTKRGLGVMLIVSGAALGGLLAGVVGQLVPWRWAYFIGGIAGLILLAMRMKVKESRIFEHMIHDRKLDRGNPVMLIKKWSLFKSYIRCILVGIPVWYILGIVVTLSPELAKEKAIATPIAAGMSVILSFAGIMVGEYICGIASQLWQSRRKAVLVFLGIGLVSTMAIFKMPMSAAWQFNLAIFAFGAISGYWVTFNTMNAEQFGTNLRATAVTSIPCFVRGSVIPMNMLFAWMHNTLGHTYQDAALYLGVVVILVALVAVYLMPETFHRDLDFVEK